MAEVEPTPAPAPVPLSTVEATILQILATAGGLVGALVPSLTGAETAVVAVAGVVIGAAVQIAGIFDRHDASQERRGLVL